MRHQGDLHLPALGMFLLSGLGILFYMGSAVALAMTGIMSLVAGPAGRLEAMSFFSLAWTALAVCVLLAPSGFFSLRRLLNQPDIQMPALASRRILPVMLVVWLLLLAVGYGISRNVTLSLFFLPPLQVLAVILPVLGLLLLALRGLSLGSAGRVWGVVAIGLLLTPALILLVEFLVILMGLALGGIGLSMQPGALEAIRELSRRFSQTSEFDPQQLQELLTPLAANPAVIFVTLALVAGIIPVLEELLKPLAVWLLAWRKLSPMEGLLAGALSGATFAFLESLGMLATPAGEAWLLLAAGRAGTVALHIACSALVGWGLALAWSERKYFQLAMSYGLAIVLHGSWNGLSLLSGFAGIVPFDASAELPFARSLGRAAPAALLVLLLAILVVMARANRFLQPAVIPLTKPPESAEDVATKSGL